MTKQELKDSIALVVNANGNGGITGTNLQEKLFELVDVCYTPLLPNGYKYINETRDFQADDAGYILVINSGGDTPVYLTMPEVFPFQEGDYVGIKPYDRDSAFCNQYTTNTDNFVRMDTGGKGELVVCRASMHDDGLLDLLSTLNTTDNTDGLVKTGLRFLHDNLGGSSSLFPNGVKVITESRTLQADDAGYVLMLESPDSETQVALTIPIPSILNVGDNFGIIVSDGNDNANNGWIDEEGSPIRPLAGAITLFTTTSFEGNNVTITVNSPQVEDGVNKSTITRYLYDKVNASGDIFITKTKYEIDGLISTNALVKGATYKITGVHPTLYNDGTNSGTTILLKAISENVLETQGTGIFYNPKYNQAVDGFGIWDNKMYGTFSTIVGNFDYRNKETVTADNGAVGKILANGMIQYISGNWSLATSITGGTSGATANVVDFVSPSYAVNDKVIWGGYSWTNVNGNIGASTNVLNLNAEWTKDVYDTTNYNIAYDLIEYDYANDLISRRYDAVSNIDVIYTKPFLGFSAISVQQFGNNINTPSGVGVSNKIINNSYDESINFNGYSQSNFNFQYGSSQSYIIFGKGSSQIYITFSSSQQSDIIFGYNSSQANLTLIEGSQQLGIILGRLSRQSTVLLAQNSSQVDLIINESKFQQNLTFGQNSQVNFNHKTLNSNIVNATFKTNNVNIPDISSATYIYNATLLKEIYTRPDGTLKLKFMNDSDVLEVHGIAD